MRFRLSSSTAAAVRGMAAPIAKDIIDSGGAARSGAPEIVYAACARVAAMPSHET